MLNEAQRSLQVVTGKDLPELIDFQINIDYKVQVISIQMTQPIVKRLRNVKGAYLCTSRSLFVDEIQESFNHGSQ